MSDIMTSMGLDINDFKASVNQLQESTAKMATGVKGNMLAMAGGILGVGAVIYSFAEKSNADFDKLAENSANLSKEFSKLTSSSGFDAINDAMGKTVKLTDELSVAEAKSAEARENWKVGYWEGLKLLFQGKGLGDREVETQLAIQAAIKEKGRIQILAIAGSKEELAMSELRLNGTKQEIEAAEKALKLSKELQDIQGSFFQDAVKDKLTEEALRRSANEAEKEARDEAAADAKYFADEEKAAMTEFYSEQEKLESEAAKQREHDRDQKAEFLKEEENAAKKAQDAAKKEGEEIESANKQMQAAEQQLVDLETEKLTLKDQSAVQSGKVSDAEENLAKAAKGTVEWYERAAELAKERLKLETLIGERAKAYAKSTSAGRKFDRQQVKEGRENVKARQRLDRQIARENGRPAPAVNGAAAMVAPRPMMQPNAPAAPANGAQGGAVAMMQVASLVVQELKSK